MLIVGPERSPETFLANIFRGLADHHDVQIVHRLGSPRARSLRARAGAAVGLTEPGAADPVAAALVAIRRRRPDVIYFPWNSAAISGAVLYELGIPVVVSCRGSQVGIAPWDPSRSLSAEALATSLTGAATVHCVSDDMADQVVALGVARERIEVIRPAVDVTRFAPPAAARPATTDRLRIVTTGSLIWRKGIEDLVVALGRVVEAGVDGRLIVIGDGPERDRIRLAAADLGLADRVELRGRLAPDAVRAELLAADVFALPSVFEGISNAVLEAMATGLTAVAATVGGMAEAITDGVDGVLLAPRDPQAWGDALLALARDPGLRARLGAAGRERVVSHHRLDDQVRAYARMLDVAARRSR